MPGIIAILIANLIWGAAPPIFKFGLQDIPPFTLAFIRFFGAGLIFLPFALKYHKPLNGDQLKNITLGGIWGISINIAFFFAGLPLAPSINVHIISALGPLVLYILSLALLKEKPHSEVLKGIMLSLVGVCVIVFAPLIRGQISAAPALAVGPMLMGNLFFALSMLGAVMITIYTKKIKPEVHPLVLTTYQFFIGSIPFIPFMLRELQTWSFTQLTPENWLVVGYGMILSSGVAYVAHNYAVTRLTAQEIGVFTYMMPVVAVLVAIPLLGEYPDMFFVIGAICVIIGMIFSQRHPHYREVRKKLKKKK
ncbi:MAG: DMT family transporter [Weeksellaceae bacterium]